jgi:hypothetical protein
VLKKFVDTVHFVSMVVITTVTVGCSVEHRALVAATILALWIPSFTVVCTTQCSKFTATHCPRLRCISSSSIFGIRPQLHRTL